MTLIDPFNKDVKCYINKMFHLSFCREINKSNIHHSGE